MAVPPNNDRERNQQADEGLGRRDAIKKGVAGAAVAGVVWSAPKIEGVTVRPDYASAQSVLPGTFTAFTYRVDNFADATPVENWPSANLVVPCSNGTTVTISVSSALTGGGIIGAQPVHNIEGPPGVIFTAVTGTQLLGQPPWQFTGIGTGMVSAEPNTIGPGGFVYESVFTISGTCP